MSNSEKWTEDFKPKWICQPSLLADVVEAFVPFVFQPHMR
jgi:hypothetical protein